ncbi:hypothetical protein DP939_22085 [Spongiactinospora rosea]|uniref:Lipoprotein n=1 Tax=Spongiactinospora rosea TaxID=2248750 RepID=A0A366LWC6_9ACTN|nr:hypothetical protein DP939_22085 [Spongiactinospora rosea]
MTTLAGRASLATGMLALACLSGCSDDKPLAVLGAGTMDGASWRVELVEDTGEFCTRAWVADVRTSYGCAPAPRAADLPVNFVLDGSDPRILLIYGIAAPKVVRMESHGDRTLAVPLRTQAAAPDRRYFAYAVRPGTARDLIAFAASGEPIFSGAAKIREFS